jgi:hypothetical protein
LDGSELSLALLSFLFLFTFVLEMGLNFLFRFDLLLPSSLGTLILLLEFRTGLRVSFFLSALFRGIEHLLLRLARHCWFPVAIASLSQIHKINIHPLSYAYSNNYSKEKSV